MRTASLRRRVTLAALALLTVALLAVEVFVYASLQYRLEAGLSERLADRAALARELAPGPSTRDAVDRLSGEGITAQVRAPSGAIVEGDPRPEPPASERATDGAARPRPPPRRRPRHGPTLATTLQDGTPVTLVASRGDVDAMLARLLGLELLGSLAVLGLAAALISRVVGFTLRPLDRVAETAARIARGSTNERLRPSRTDTELGRLAEAFDAMVDALEAALNGARSSEERMRQFLSDASHELRTPLAAVAASAETILRNDPDREQRERLAVETVREATRAGRLVDDLLAAARTAEGVPLSPERLDLVALVADEVARARLVGGSTVLSLQAPDRVEVEADPQRIGQVLANLLDNARHATPEDGSTEVAVARRGAWVEVSVTDSGPGVPAADRDRIFERFVRLDPARSRDRFGSGLGLAIARSLAEAHGGSLLCLDAPVGARFVLRLPLGSAADG